MLNVENKVVVITRASSVMSNEAIRKQQSLTQEYT
jgi:hypothetical protein